MSLKEELRQQYRQNFGDESAFFKLQGSDRADLPPEMEILLWHPDQFSDLTTLATLGMSDRVMPGGQRAELHFAWAGQLSREQESEMVEFLANLALFPFLSGQGAHLWQVIELDGEIPHFRGKKALLFHPPFHEDGWALAQSSQGDVRILNVVPISDDEKTLAIHHGIAPLVERWQKEGFNPFERN